MVAFKQNLHGEGPDEEKDQTKILAEKYRKSAQLLLAKSISMGSCGCDYCTVSQKVELLCSIILAAAANNLDKTKKQDAFTELVEAVTEIAEKHR